MMNSMAGKSIYVYQWVVQQKLLALIMEFTYCSLLHILIKKCVFVFDIKKQTAIVINNLQWCNIYFQGDSYLLSSWICTRSRKVWF